MYAFEYHRPDTLSAAVADLANPDAKVLAGGMTLLPTMKQRLASPAALIDLKNVRELAGIAREGDNLVIGAMAKHAEVARSNVVQAAIPALAALAGIIGDPHVRNMGTIGGSLANNDPAADYPAAALALGATIVTDKRRIAAAGFFHRACSRRRSSLANSSPRSAFRSRRRPRTRSSATRRRATRWSASSSPRPPAAFGSRSPAPARAASFALRNSKPR